MVDGWHKERRKEVKKKEREREEIKDRKWEVIIPLSVFAGQFV
jgi:hypothetical protein